MTSAPTRELRRHHDVEAPQVDAAAFRQGWRIRTRLDQLLADRRITPGEWQAAVEYRNAWGKALELVAIDPAMLHVPGAASADAAMIARLDAVTRLRVVEAAIGAERARLLLASVVNDLPWAVIARHWHRDPHTVRNWTVSALRALWPVWARVG